MLRRLDPKVEIKRALDLVRSGRFEKATKVYLKTLLRDPPMKDTGGVFIAPQRDEDRPFLSCPPEMVERWNGEWLRYLEREWTVQLEPWSAYGARPELPADPLALLALEVGHSPPLSLYCDRDAILSRRVLELGCGCGNLGKHLARWTDHYVGIDFSTLALKVARLVSPDNARYVHAADYPGIRQYFGGIDTIVGRYFWIHQNFILGRRIIELFESLLTDGGRVYADFFWPAPSVQNYKVLSPDDALSKEFPSATFAYSRADVERLVAGSRLHIEREVVHEAMQRRYVVLVKR